MRRSSPEISWMRRRRCLSVFGWTYSASAVALMLPRRRRNSSRVRRSDVWRWRSYSAIFAIRSRWESRTVGVERHAQQVLVRAELLVGHHAGCPADDRAEQRVPGLLEAGLEACRPLAGIRDPDRDRAPDLGMDRLDPLDERRLAGRGNAEERPAGVVAVVEQGSRSRRPGAPSRPPRPGGATSTTTYVRSRSQPSRVARPSTAPSTLPPASCSKKSLIRFFSVSRSISSIFLIATAVWFAAARARSTSVVPSALIRPEELVVGDDRDGDAAARPLRASSGPSSERPIAARASASAGAEAFSRSSSVPRSSR